MSASEKISTETLRERAEALLQAPRSDDGLSDLSTIAQLAHELAVHQAELELQNEELRETRLALQKSRDDYASLFEHAPVGYAVLDPSGIILRANSTWRTMLGRVDEDLRGQPITDILVPEDASLFLARFRSFFRNPADSQIDVRMLRKDGGQFHARIQAAQRSQGQGDAEPLDSCRAELLIVIFDITQQFRAQQEILQHRERLGALVEILQYHAKDRQDFLDHALDQALELTRSELGYIYFYDEDRRLFELNTWSKQVMPQCLVTDPQTCYELDKTGIWGEAVRQRKPIVLNDFQAEHPLKRGYPEGHVRLHRFLTIPVFHEDRIVAVVGVANKADDYVPTDILQLTLLMEAVWKTVESNQDKEALRERERYLSTVLATTADGFYILDARGRLREVNDSYCRMSGYTREELLGRSIHFLDIIETPQQTAGRMAELRLKGSSALFETRHRKKDGSTFDVEVSMSFIDNRGGEMICFCRDLTSRRWNEARIAMLGQIIDDAPISITVHNAEGQFLFANRTTLALHGYHSLAEFLSVRLQDLDAPESQAQITERMDLIFRSGQSQFEVRHRRADGSLFPLEVLAKAIEWDGEPAVLSIATDITLRKVLEQQLLEAHKLESVGRLAGGVAHDFNNMLSVILGHMELAIETVAHGSPLHHNLSQAQKAAARSAELTKQLLAFARKQTIAPRLVHLNEAVPSMLGMLRRLIGEDCDLQWRSAADLWPVTMDPSQIDQILTNLCVNARDAMDRGGTIRIEANNLSVDAEGRRSGRGPKPGEWVRLSVSDEGTGMDEQTLSRIFEPFFTTKELGKGTGLGLAIVHGIIQQNGGFIEARSELGQGTRFDIYLPRHSTPQKAVEADPSCQPTPGGRETILIVEDEPAILSLTAERLERLGYRVLACASPTEALGLLESHTGPVDLLLTDVVMPKMNGRELAATLAPRYPTLKFLFMSGYTNNIIERHGVLDEGVDFIVKPFTGRQLASAVRNILDRH